MASALFFLMFCNLVIAEVNGNETIDTLEFKDENLVSKPKMDETHLETIRNVDAAKGTLVAVFFNYSLFLVTSILGIYLLIFIHTSWHYHSL